MAPLRSDLCCLSWQGIGRQTRGNRVGMPVKRTRSLDHLLGDRVARELVKGHDVRIGLPTPHPNDLDTVACNDALAEAQRTYDEFRMAGLTGEGEVVANEFVPGAVRTTNDRPTVGLQLWNGSRVPT